MKRRAVTGALIAAIAAAATLALSAATAQPPAAAPTPLYRVEIIVFAYREIDADELFRQTAPTAIEAAEPALTPDFATWLLDRGLPAEPAGIGMPGATGTAALVGFDSPFRVLAPEELELTRQYRQIAAATSAYTPLLHAGWIQTALPEAQAEPFDLARLGSINPVGTVRLHRSQRFHVRVDLTYRGRPSAANAAVDELAFEIAPRYRLQASQPMRNGELRYFDHPAFGVLVKFTEVPPTPAPGTGTRPAA